MSKSNSDTTLETIDRIIEAGIYIYIIFMFLSKGESIRNIVLFGNFALWLTTLKYRKDLYLLKEPVSVFFWLYTASFIFSVVFSIDPLYSFLSLRNDPVKPAILFPVIATVMSDERKLKKVPFIIFFSLALIVLNGFFSFFINNFSLLKIDTPLMYIWHNKFASYINILLPFMLVLFFQWHERSRLKIVLVILFVISVFALILSTSRENYLTFLCIICIWAYYLSRVKGFSFFRIMSGITLMLLVLGVLSWFSSPHVKERIVRTAEDIYTLNARTKVWEESYDAIRLSPFVGWGHGKDIFHYDEVYKDTSIKGPPLYKEGQLFDDPHNTFIKILFHQGIIGALPYIGLILTALIVFWRGAFNKEDLRSHMLIACFAVIAGNYVVNAMFTLMKLRYLAVILGIGMAALGTDEDSDH